MNRPHLLMNGSFPHEGNGNEIPVALKEMLKGGLSLLWRGFEYSRDLERERSEFAVAADALYHAGLSDIDLRWLISRGYVEFAPTAAKSFVRKQRLDKNLPIEEVDVAFILTKAGAAFTFQILAQSLLPISHMPGENGKARPVTDHLGHSAGEPKSCPQKPAWDQERKELRFGPCVVKIFRWAAVNQETILMAFEEEDWPARIDDPLPQKLNQDPKTRLHDTIKCLNRNHRKPLIRFTGDGTGEGILWGLVGNTDPAG